LTNINNSKEHIVRANANIKVPSGEISSNKLHALLEIIRSKDINSNSKLTGYS
jgi:hypothetical protein